MRQVYQQQLLLSAGEGCHPRAAELKAMSGALDAMGSHLEGVHDDLLGARRADAKRGRKGLSAEQVLRAAIIKQMFDVSYDELAFHLEDSLQLRAFCRLAPSSSPKKSTLQQNISAIRAETWEGLNRALVLHAQTKKIENGRWMRTDTTVVESNIHHPLDSSLLWDSVRVLTRILRRAHEKFGTTQCNHRRRAKRRNIAILNAQTMEKRVPLYKDLLKITNKTRSCAARAMAELDARGEISALRYAAQLRHFLPLVSQVIDQAERRVLRDEQVPATEKIVSIFEPHTDIIRKDRRDTYYGHKVSLSTGKSSLVLDVVIETGNPADSTLAVRATQRHATLFGDVPERVAFDGGFASKQNLIDIKSAGTAQVCFSKPAGVPVEEMTTTKRIRRTLKNFRAGIEAGISFLKRSFGWTRASWRGLPHFRAYVWCSAVAHNLLVLARALLGRDDPA